jgi:hypothetical protein
LSSGLDRLLAERKILKARTTRTIVSNELEAAESDLRGTGYGGGMFLFIPAAVAQTLGGVLYEANPTIPFMVMSAGMVIVWAFLRVRETVKMEA